MAIYEGSQSIYTDALREYLHKGFWLAPNADGSGKLFYMGEEIMTISRKALTYKGLKEVCSQWLEKVGV